MKKFISQKGVSMMEAVTASSILAISVVVFMTLQANQEDSFTKLRKFERSAYTVELMFEEMAAVYNPIASQYGEPTVDTEYDPGDNSVSNFTLKVKGLRQLPGRFDIITVENVGGSYQVISYPESGGTPTHDFDDDNDVTLTLKRSDLPTTATNFNMAAIARENARITFRSNAEGSLDPYHDLDLSKFEDTTYVSSLTNEKVKADLDNWGGLLKKILGPVRSGDVRLIEVEEVAYVQDVDLDGDGVTDQDADGNNITESVEKKQVTITITQDGTTEKFRRLFLAGT